MPPAARLDQLAKQPDHLLYGLTAAQAERVCDFLVREGFVGPRASCGADWGAHEAKGTNRSSLMWTASASQVAFGIRMPTLVLLVRRVLATET